MTTITDQPAAPRPQPVPLQQTLAWQLREAMKRLLDIDVADEKTCEWANIVADVERLIGKVQVLEADSRPGRGNDLQRQIRETYRKVRPGAEWAGHFVRCVQVNALAGRVLCTFRVQAGVAKGMPVFVDKTEWMRLEDLEQC